MAKPEPSHLCGYCGVRIPDRDDTHLYICDGVPLPNEHSEWERWWLSFADGDGFRGVAVVRAADMISAVAKTHALGINPGGQVLGYVITEDMPVPENILISNKADAKRYANGTVGN